MRRAFAVTAAILFALSWIFPVGAGLVRSPTILPRWWGAVDVVVAFVVAVMAISIHVLVRGNADKQAERATYRIYRGSMHAILVVAVLVMLAGDRVNWANCATGFLWRAWLLVYSLPWWLVAARHGAENVYPHASQQQG